MIKSFFLFLPLSAILFVSCATNPVSVSKTGETQIDTTPQPQSESLVANGKRTFDVYKRTKATVSNSQVSRVGNRIQRVVPLQSAEWEFVTFDNTTPNAFALPGGKVGVHTGIIPIAKNDAGLATILAHEIAHVSLNHHDQSSTRSTVTGLLGAVANAALGAGVGQIVQTGANLGYSLPNSRKNEIAADQVGLMFMARAGYDPREAINFWQRFSDYKSANGGGAGTEFLSTHPLDTTRIGKLHEIMPIAVAEYNKNR